MDALTCLLRSLAPVVRARVAKTERGASLLEYAQLVALIAVVCVVAVTTLGIGASGSLSSAGSSI